jgi:hypothetical protein
MPVEAALIKRIRKLRWIGRDDEARELERMLCCVALHKWSDILVEPIRTA